MKYLKLLPLIVLMTFLQGCPMEPDESPDGAFTVKNNSGDAISVYYNTLETEMQPKDFLPQALKNINDGDVLNETFRNKYFDKNNKLWIIVYKKQTLENHSWKEIQEKGISDKLYGLTLQDLRAMDFEIMVDGD